MDSVSNYLTTRSFLAQNVDTILEGLIAARTMKKNDTDDLFADPDESVTQLNIHWRRSKSTFTKREILAAERESLGIYVSGSPLSDYEALIDWCKMATARDDIFLVIIDKIKKIFTKSGVMMFALQLTTSGLDVEGVIFPKKALGLSPVLVEKDLFWVRGTIQQPKKKPAKSESVDEETQMDAEKESGEGLKEYEELPKLIIEHIVPFESGILPVFEGDEKSSLAMNRKDMISGLNWIQLKSEPQNYELIILENRNQKSKQNNFSGTHNNLQNILRTIYLPKSLGVDVLREVKTQLQSRIADGLVEVQVQVETNEGFKPTKTTFWVSPDVYNLYKQHPF